MAGKGEILIKIRSVGLNYRDIAIATSTYPIAVKDQVIPCSDMSGEVAQVGAEVDGFFVGDRVIAPVNPAQLYGFPTNSNDTFGGPRDGMLREYIALPAHILIKLPESSHSFSQWAAMIATASTVWNSFYANTPLKPGDTVLLLGKSVCFPNT